MILSSSDGTLKTVEDLRKSWNVLHEAYLRIQEINDGTYNSRIAEAQQFDYCTCPELANWTDNLVDIIGKIEKIVYQKNKNR